MVDLALLQSVSYIAGALGVCVAASYYVMNLKAQQTNMKANLETRQAQLYMEMYNAMYNQEIMKHLAEIRQYTYSDYDDFMKKYGPIQNSESYSKLTKVWWFYTEMGTLVYRGLLTLDDVSGLISLTPIEIWSQFQVAIEGLRDRYFTSGYSYISFEYLAKVQMARVQSGEGKKMIGDWLNNMPKVAIPPPSELRVILNSGFSSVSQ
jgi:hypothetical protein